MIILKKRIEYHYGETIKIKPIFDVHYGSNNCDVSKFKKYIEDYDENTYFIGGGDLLDSITVTDPRYRKSNDSTSNDAVIDEQVNKMIEFLKPIKKRIIALGSGNHEDVDLK